MSGDGCLVDAKCASDVGSINLLQTIETKYSQKIINLLGATIPSSEWFDTSPVKETRYGARVSLDSSGNFQIVELSSIKETDDLDELFRGQRLPRARFLLALFSSFQLLPIFLGQPSLHVFEDRAILVLVAEAVHHVEVSDIFIEMSASDPTMASEFPSFDAVPTEKAFVPFTRHTNTDVQYHWAFLLCKGFFKDRFNQDYYIISNNCQY